MAVTAIASAAKYYIKESSRVEYFPIEAKKQLELAYLYLDNAETENQNEKCIGAYGKFCIKDI